MTCRGQRSAQRLAGADAPLQAGQAWQSGVAPRTPHQGPSPQTQSCVLLRCWRHGGQNRAAWTGPFSTHRPVSWAFPLWVTLTSDQI